MKNRFLSLFTILILLLSTSCTIAGDGKNKQGNPSGQTETSENTNTESKLSTDSAFTTNENDRNILELYSIKKAAELYAEAANKVKSEGAGFSRSEWQKISDIKTGDTTGIANRVLDIVAENLLTSEADAFGDSMSIVQKGSTNRINLLFPIYNKDYACILQKRYDCIKSATYKKNDNKYEITLTFADALNAEMGDEGFGQIMTPFIRNGILDTIKKYVFVADLNSLALDFLYRDCYLSCVIDAKTMQMISMEQHITAYVNASAEIRILGFSTDFLNGTATVENHLYFYDFTW